MNPLDELAELFEDLTPDPTTDQIYKLYGIYKHDFKDNTLQIDGVNIKVNANQSKFPLFKGKDETFVHIVTHESEHSKKRNFDRHRANRIHWIKPILEQRSDPRIKYFEHLNEDGKNVKYYWFQEKNFLVILKPIEPDLLLLTSFYVDKENRNKYKQWYEGYKESLKTKNPTS